MDEATANIDTKTEDVIQQAISTLLNQATVLTIAHRIKTIISYDRILVLSEGERVQYDTPENLLKDKDGIFYSIYEKSAS